jgi:transcriptional regulator with XRE-family HTH domain
VAANKTPAQREDLAHSAYELSLRGKSSREIAGKLGISHPTAATYVKAETERRRAERPDIAPWLIDGHRKAMARAWEELDERPSAHASAQLLHALNSALSSIATVAGANAPRQVDLHHSGRSARDAIPDGLQRLPLEEKRLFLALFLKVLGTDVEEELIAEAAEVIEIYPLEDGS